MAVRRKLKDPCHACGSEYPLGCPWCSPTPLRRHPSRPDPIEETDEAWRERRVAERAHEPKPIRDFDDHLEDQSDE